MMLEHHAIWALMTDEWPPKGLDVEHRNENGEDNRWANLRLATRSENLQNITAPRKDNKSGYRGVCWNKALKKWRVTIKVDGRQIGLGHFDDPAEAGAAYLEAKRRLHPAWNGATP